MGHPPAMKPTVCSFCKGWNWFMTDTHPCCQQAQARGERKCKGCEMRRVSAASR